VHDRKSSSVLSSAWNPWKLNKNITFSRCQEYMHFCESIKYQFVAVSSREMMRDLVRVVASSPAEAMVAS
jgi:uncharacterized protein YueI